MWRYGKLVSVLILMPLAFAFAVALDIYIPAVPKLVQSFHTTPTQLQATLSLFILFFGIGQLFIGPVSDQFGRRSVAVWSCLAYLASSLLCAAAVSVGMLVLMRMVQAVSACGMMVTANAIVRDAFDEEDSARMYSYLNGAISMSPLFAPLIGAYLDVWFGWQACFIALAVFGFLATVLAFFGIPETLHKTARVKIKRSVFQRYATILMHREFRFYLFCSGVGVACLFTFFSISPYILIQMLGVPEEHFGYYFGVMGLLFLLGSLIAARILHWTGIFYNTLIGGVLILVGGLWMWIWAAYAEMTPLGFVLPMVPISIGAAFLIGSAFAGGMAPFRDRAGMAAALLGCYQFLFASVVGSLVVAWHAATAVPMAVAMVILGFVTIAYWSYRYSRQLS